MATLQQNTINVSLQLDDRLYLIPARKLSLQPPMTGATPKVEQTYTHTHIYTYTFITQYTHKKMLTGKLKKTKLKDEKKKKKGSLVKEETHIQLCFS